MAPPSPHPKYSWLARALADDAVRSAVCREFDGVAYRYAASRYSTTRQLLSGEGAWRAGGRWNAPEAFHAVYCASDPELANREYFAGLRLAGFEPHVAMPLTGKAIRIRLERVLSLVGDRDLALLGLRETDIRDDPWRKMTDKGEESLCQAVGRAALEAGMEGLIVPSAEARNASEFNVILIRENLPSLRGKVWTMRAKKR